MAATALVLRESAARRDACECFMVVRSAKSPFMPSSLVFPGGRLDPVDHADGPADADDAYVAAARRECREEVGLDLADIPLVWFDTWCTPSAEPRRYLTRFFVAVLPPALAESARADEHETHDGRWATAEEHLAAWARGAVDLPPPTLCTLLRLQSGGLAGLVALAERVADLRRPILPKAILEDGLVQVVMPHDPGYGAALGEGAEVPQRVLDLPRRFVLRDGRWVPC